MSITPLRAGTQATNSSERLDRIISMAVSVALHVLALMALLYASKAVLSPPEGASSGGARVKVDFVGTSKPSEPSPPQPRPKPSEPDKQERRDAAPERAQRKQDSALVQQAKDVLREPKPPARPATPPPPASETAERRLDTPWGQPPGLLPSETAPVNAGPTYGPAPSPIPGAAAPGQGAMAVGGHQIYYDVFGDARLRQWRDAGMTELSFPLPGLRQLMVCPLEIVLRRGDGGCRLVEPDDPELANIGDARRVVQVMRVYRRGELIWRGPGFYR